MRLHDVSNSAFLHNDQSSVALSLHARQSRRRVECANEKAILWSTETVGYILKTSNKMSLHANNFEGPLKAMLLHRYVPDRNVTYQTSTCTERQKVYRIKLKKPLSRCYGVDHVAARYGEKRQLGYFWQPLAPNIWLWPCLLLSGLFFESP